MTPRFFGSSDVEDAVMTWYDECVRGVVGERAEQIRGVDALCVGGGVENVSDLIGAVKMTEVNGRTED